MLILSLMSACALSACGGGFQPAGSDGAVSAQGGVRISDTDLLQISQLGSAALWEDSVPGSSAWTKATDEAIEKYGGEMLATTPSDIADYCPNYKNLSKKEDRISVWIRLLSAMAYEESGFRADARHIESFKASNLHSVTSLGLMQLSQESGNDYGCGFTSDNDVRDAAQNLTCAVRILNQWVSRDHRVAGGSSGRWLGGAEYWGVLRTPKTVQKIKALTSLMSICSA